MSALFSAAGDPSPALLIGAVAVMCFVLFIFVAIWASRYVRVGPDEVMVVFGRQRLVTDSEGRQKTVGMRFVKGGGTFVFPVLEYVKILSLKPVGLDLKVVKVPTCDAGALDVVAKAQVKIGSDDASMARAAETLLGKTPDEVKDVAGQVFESSLRSIIGSQTAADILQTQPRLAPRLQEAANAGLGQLGLGIVSLSIREVVASKA